MTFDRDKLTRLILILQTLILAFLLLEAFDTASFSALFHVEDYWVNTRGWNPDDFWNLQSDLFISATRPDGRYFNFIDVHRLSSIFLEPVSLGNYCTIVVAFTCATYDRLSWLTRAFLILSTVVFLVGSDGRLAATSCVAIIALTPFVPRLPRHSTIAYLPLVAIGTFMLVLYGGFHVGADDFAGRSAYMVELLRSWNLAEWLGVSGRATEDSMDCGLAYLILSQSLLGVVVIWVVITFASREDTIAQKRFTHALAIYISLTMMVSYSLFTIKTAALLWFIHGSLQNRRLESLR
jgi:putative polymerase